MADINSFPRQPCRCGYKFATLQAFLLHCDYGEPLPHDNPADIGLHEVDGEWTHVMPRVETDLVKSVSGAPKVRKEKPVPYVPAAERPASDFERTCEACGNVFERPRGRGRPPKKCPPCRGI